MDNHLNETIIEKVVIKKAAIYKAIAMLPPPPFEDKFAKETICQQNENTPKQNSEKCLNEIEPNNEKKVNDTMNETKTVNELENWRTITDPKLRKKMYLKMYNQHNKEKLRKQKKDNYEVNKDKRKKQCKCYYELNKEKILKRSKVHYTNNRNKRTEYGKTYRASNKDKLKEQNKAYYEANKNKLNEQSKAYYETNKDKIKEQSKAYNTINKDKRKAYREANKDKRKAYRQANKDKLNEYDRNRIKTDIQYKLTKKLRNRLRSALKGSYKSGSAVKDLGCSIEELKVYLESKFQPGMTWDNWGQFGWHIDHIKPLASFDLTDRNQLLKACHYTNLQPLWAVDNLSKKDCLNWEKKETVL